MKVNPPLSRLRLNDATYAIVTTRCNRPARRLQAGPAPRQPLLVVLASSEHHGRERQRKVQTRAQESLRSRATKLTRRKAGGPTFTSFCLHFPDSIKFIAPLAAFRPQPTLFIARHTRARRICARHGALIVLAIPSTSCSHVHARLHCPAHFLPPRLRTTNALACLPSTFTADINIYHDNNSKPIHFTNENCQHHQQQRHRRVTNASHLAQPCG